jgi:hypothetical protein
LAQQETVVTGKNRIMTSSSVRTAGEALAISELWAKVGDGMKG